MLVKPSGVWVTWKLGNLPTIDCSWPLLFRGLFHPKLANSLWYLSVAGADKAFSGIDSLATCTSYTITLRLSNTGQVERTSYGASYLNDTVAVQNALSQRIEYVHCEEAD